MKQILSEEFRRMQKLAGLVNEDSGDNYNKNLRNIESELEDAGFNFDDGILGGVGSGGAGYYDYISDKISGYDLNKFDEGKFNEWYDNFSFDSFQSSNYDNEMMDDYEIDRNIISQIPPGFYNVGSPGNLGGFAQIEDNGNVTLYANPVLSDNSEEYITIFSVDTTGNIVNDISKEEVVNKLKENLKTPGSWAII